MWPTEGPLSDTGPCDLKRGPLWPDMRFLLVMKGTYCSNKGVAGSPWFYLSISYVQKPRQPKKKVCSNRSMCMRDIAGGGFGAPGWALEARNRALAPPNEVVHDSEWF